MVTQIQTLTTLLQKPAVTVEEIAQVVGEVKEQRTNEVIFTPKSEVFTQASVVFQSDSQEVAHVSLVFTIPVPVVQFKEKFGEYTNLPVQGLHHPQRVMFKSSKNEASFSVAIIASLQDETVTRVVLRRDKKF